ncbi:MAG: hypothetical protein CMH64_04500 [Nanoarchaeota archaeon]|nr:hypothetical protein [Nanoarchaeota archaeon]|tara:strand:- start:8852 stop:9229 length:378 start_codon:yes stop_codon:yes gene_type:complete
MLTLQYVPSDELINLDSERKVGKLLKIIKQDKIVLMEGRLSSKEEAELIEKTMEEIDRKFKGIEIASLEPQIKKDFASVLRDSIFKMFFGNKRGMTVMGPANIIKEIKKDPNKLQLYTSNRRGRK